MASNLLGGFWKFCGLGEDDLSDEKLDLTIEEIEEPIIEPVFSKRSDTGKKASRSNVVLAQQKNVASIKGRNHSEVIIETPKSFDNAKDIVTNLRQNKSVIVNLEGLENDRANKIWTFLMGAACALDASIEQASNRTFIIAPVTTTVTSNIQKEKPAAYDTQAEVMMETKAELDFSKTEKLF